MNTVQWETPWTVAETEPVWFYHVMDLPGLGQTTGEWDLRRTIGAYLGSCPLKGRSVLDVGCASGYLSFEMERRGANVVSFDLRDPRTDQSFVPYVSQQRNRAEMVEKAVAFHKRLKGSYWLAHRLLKSKAKVHYGNVYQLPDELDVSFDVVFLGQVLVHLNNPFNALAAAASMAREHVVVVEGVLPDAEPKTIFLPSVATGQNFSWWQCSLGFYRNVFRIFGFEIESVEISKHSCLAYEKPRFIDLHTITAKRVEGEPRSQRLAA